MFIVNPAIRVDTKFVQNFLSLLLNVKSEHIKVEEILNGPDDICNNWCSFYAGFVYEVYYDIIKMKLCIKLYIEGNDTISAYYEYQMLG